MKINSRIYVAGHRGLVGSAIIRTLEQKGFENLITRTHAELELLDAVAVQKFFAETKPEYVFLAAAKVGGIHATAHILLILCVKIYWYKRMSSTKHGVTELKN